MRVRVADLNKQLTVLTLEKIQRPIRDSQDLLQATGFPILAVLSRADSRRPQRLIGNTGPDVGGWPRIGTE